MRAMKFILAFMFCMNIVLADEYILPANEELLTRAKVGRHEYIDVIHEIRNYFFKDRSKEEIYNAMLLIKPLSEIETAHNFPIFEVKPVEELAERLLQVSSRILDLFVDSNEVFDIYLFYSNNERVFDLIENQNLNLTKNTYTDFELVDSIPKIKKIYKTAEERKYPYFILDKIKNLESVIVKRLFQQTDLSNTELQNLVKSFMEITSIVNIIDHIQTLYFQNKETIFKLPLIDLILVCADKARELDPKNDNEIHGYISELAGKFLIADIENPAFIDDFGRLLGLLNAKTLDEMFGYFQMYIFAEVPPSKINLLEKLLTKVKIHFQYLNPVKYDLISYRLQVLKVKDYASNYEGTYRIKAGNNNGILTIFKTSPLSVSYALSLVDSEIMDVGEYGVIQSDNSLLIADTDFTSQRINGAFHPVNFLKIKLENGKITGQINDENGVIDIQGQKIESYSVNLADKDFELQPGVYKTKLDNSRDLILRIRKTMTSTLSASVEIISLNTGKKVIFNYGLSFDEKGVYQFITYLDVSRNNRQRKIWVYEYQGQLIFKEQTAAQSSGRKLILTKYE